ncbi:transmembrane protein [Rhynchospora pubera]|uniref:Transmembrane protein n=1 Tax=Rhynchospora pubera TaxID=906938 RepID=A0AAV8HT56_9POAL|nr:transmembrane protein [Rhynchospora pubera]
MTSSKEIIPYSSSMNDPPACVCPVEPKSSATTLTWLGKVRMVGTACLSTLARPTTGPVLIACVCLAALVYNKRNHTRPHIGRAEAATNKAANNTMLHRSMSIAALHGGKVALQRILDAQEARIDVAGLAGMVEKMKTIISTQPISFNELHRAAAKLEMTGREDDAIKMLQDALDKAQKNKQPHEAYELEMLLVEMLIYKGNQLDRALQCKCLKEKDISDARVPLYQAVIYTMKCDKTCAQRYYEDFQNIRNKFHWPDGIEEGSPLYGIVHVFDEFEYIVENLKKEIEHAHRLKAGTVNWKT